MDLIKRMIDSVTFGTVLVIAINTSLHAVHSLVQTIAVIIGVVVS